MQENSYSSESNIATVTLNFGIENAPCFSKYRLVDAIHPVPKGIERHREMWILIGELIVG